MSALGNTAGEQKTLVFKAYLLASIAFVVLSLTLPPRSLLVGGGMFITIQIATYAFLRTYKLKNLKVGLSIQAVLFSLIQTMVCVMLVLLPIILGSHLLGINISGAALWVVNALAILTYLVAQPLLAAFNLIDFNDDARRAERRASYTS